jgi:4-deoxy-L-threo-5-hexosulose-uronate ketol-isomerase
MQILHAISPNEAKGFDTQALRNNFLVEKNFVADTIQLVYTHYDRVIIGGAMPVEQALELLTYDNLKSTYFFERREAGIINVGGDGSIEVDGQVFELSKLDCLYIGKGSQKVVFKSADAAAPANFFILSAPAHQVYPTSKLSKEEASPVALGSLETSNERTIYKYIHKDGLQSCQVVMGLTVLNKGSVWNTMPSHVHDRRMEAYLYFDVPQEHRVFHFMGQPQETRHMLVANHQAIVSPPWSIHSGAGTTNYSFIWGMAGENLDFTDMDFAAIADLR